MREDAGGGYRDIGSIKKGAKIAVVARKGTWVKVAVDGKEGWVSEKNLSATEVKGDDNPFSQFGKTANLNIAESGRGNLKYEAIQYGKDAKLNLAPMDFLVKFRDSLYENPKEWENFMKEGKVGESAGQ
jgi:uncharacterized protein YgiM (DUF1202 family)